MGFLWPCTHSPNTHWVPGTTPGVGNTKEKKHLLRNGETRMCPTGNAPGVPNSGWQWVREGFTAEVTLELTWARLSSGKRIWESRGRECIPGQPRGQCVQSHWDVRMLWVSEAKEQVSVQLGHSLGRWERRWNSPITICDHLAEEYGRILALESFLMTSVEWYRKLL